MFPVYRMPAEWLPHASTWVSWPRNLETWPQNLAAAQREFVSLVRAIAVDEPVRVLAGRPADFAAAEAALKGVDGVEIVDLPTNDAWARDYAPTFVMDQASGRLAAIDWKYNAWGGKYPPFDEDQQNARRIAAWLGCDVQPVEVCLEGGAVEIDESGTLLSTKSCAFDGRRNPDLAQEEIERRILEATGALRLIWLSGDALIGDDTDGHIDQLARFVPTGAILYAWTDDRSDSQYAGLAQNLADIRYGIDHFGLEHVLTPLPLPDAVEMYGRRIPASYCNFYVTNSSVIVPTFQAPQDETALAILADHFPDRRIVPLPSRELTVGLGSFHCLTQQEPGHPARDATASIPSPHPN